MNTRGLRRWLDKEGTTFQKIRDQVRHAVAIDLLRMTEMRVSEISDALGFAHHSTFTRAFSHWSGTSPTEFRATMRVNQVPKSAASPVS